MAVTTYDAAQIADVLHGRWYIYAIVSEFSEKEFVVKIGVSSQPYERYSALIAGIPFKSVMLYALVGFRTRCYKMESLLHRTFRERRTRGEWFRFSLDDKADFHTAFKKIYKHLTRKDLEWQRITEKALADHARLREKHKNRRKKRKDEFHEFRYGEEKRRKWAE